MARNLAVMVDGFNMDDVGDWRPGMKAARELGVRSPLHLSLDRVRRGRVQVGRVSQLQDPHGSVAGTPHRRSEAPPRATHEPVLKHAYLHPHQGTIRA